MTRLIKAMSLLIGTVLLLTTEIFAQAEKRAVYNSNSNEKRKIAITFDDGPHPRNTLEILDVLDEYNVKATFFIVGVNAKNYPSPLSMIVKRGHEIGNHTYSHTALKDKTKDAIYEEIVRAEKEIKNTTGAKTTLLRPPCGLYDKNTVEFALENNYKVVLWNIDTHDWAHATTSNMVSNIEKNVKGGDIILFHDYISGVNNTAEALRIIIPLLQKQGYEFVTAGELLQNV